MAEITLLAVTIGPPPVDGRGRYGATDKAGAEGSDGSGRPLRARHLVRQGHQPGYSGRRRLPDRHGLPDGRPRPPRPLGPVPPAPPPSCSTRRRDLALVPSPAGNARPPAPAGQVPP